MKPKLEKEILLGDKVMTQISPYAGEVVKITREKARSSHSYYSNSEPPTVTYSVLLPFLRKDCPSAINKSVDFIISELTIVSSQPTDA